MSQPRHCMLYAKLKDWQRRRRQRKLCCLLEAAAAELAPLNGSAWSDFETGAEMAVFVRQCKTEIENGTIEDVQKLKLWCVFAPTCDWDDVSGNADLGNRIFDLLDTLSFRGR